MIAVVVAEPFWVLIAEPLFNATDWADENISLDSAPSDNVLPSATLTLPVIVLTALLITLSKILISPFPDIALEIVPPVRSYVPLLATVPETLFALDVNVPFVTVTFPNWPLVLSREPDVILTSLDTFAELVTVPAIWVVPLPVTFWAILPPVTLYVPDVSTVFLILSAFVSNDFPLLIATLDSISAVFVTVPAITVEPSPVILLEFAPPVNV